ncbi:MAG TPA: HAD family acid phosphatase [Candidatus Deferrimicrobium sp.]|nr:HAD family acid phosphatase [Candidatus Deferrimicrobium sp.]
MPSPSLTGHHSAARPLLYLLVILSTITGCTAPSSNSRQNEAPSRADNRLDAILWQTTSAEYRVLAQMIYATAQTHLERALADPNWTALSAQKDNYQKLPPAVIMDIDETVIDTGAFQSQLARSNARFSSRPWREWQTRNQPLAVPGALEFIAAAQASGVTIFFVTNRDHPTEAATRLNLATIGVKLPSDLDTVLCRDERPDWGSDKESRRRYIAQSYRVLMLFGDDLQDFLSEYRTTAAQRTAAAVKHNTWGTKWFMLPNPMYGSWEASLYDFRNDLGSEEVSQRKFDQLR